MPNRKYPPTPLDLLFMLCDSCVHRLSPNAWKVVSYIASQHLRVQFEWLAFHRGPAAFALSRDLERVAVITDPPAGTGERPYRLVDGDAAIPGSRGPGRFAVISLDQICHGVKIKRRRRDFGTGLSRSSAAEAINQALGSGILARERRKSSTGRDLSSAYGINWDRVQEFDWQRRKGLTGRSSRRVRQPDS